MYLVSNRLCVAVREETHGRRTADEPSRRVSPSLRVVVYNELTDVLRRRRSAWAPVYAWRRRTRRGDIRARGAHSRTSNTGTKLLIYGLFQKGRVLAQDGMMPGPAGLVEAEGRSGVRSGTSC